MNAPFGRDDASVNRGASERAYKLYEKRWLTLCLDCISSYPRLPKTYDTASARFNTSSQRTDDTERHPNSDRIKESRPEPLHRSGIRRTNSFRRKRVIVDREALAVVGWTRWLRSSVGVWEVCIALWMRRRILGDERDVSFLSLSCDAISLRYAEQEKDGPSGSCCFFLDMLR